MIFLLSSVDIISLKEVLYEKTFNYLINFVYDNWLW